MKSFGKKSTVLLAIVITAAFALLGISAFFPRLTASAEEATIWEKIDLGTSGVENGHGHYRINKNADIWYNSDGTPIFSADYAYFYIQAAGGQGSTTGYGGGAGGFMLVKINLNYTTYISLYSGPAGGKYPELETETDILKNGDGYGCFILTSDSRSENFKLNLAALLGGGRAEPDRPGKGGICLYDGENDDFFSVLVKHDGADGGQGSSTFTADLGFWQQFFIYRPAGAYPSGQGGGASVYARGGDGGVLFQNGRDGSYGAGGGGAGRGATGFGCGGDAYIEVYMSNK